MSLYLEGVVWELIRVCGFAVIIQRVCEKFFRAQSVNLCYIFMDRIDTYCNVHVLLHIIMYSPSLSLSPLSLSLSSGLCWFPGPVGFDWYIHAWEGTHTQDIINTNIQSSFVAEDTSAHHWKKIWTILYLLF